MRFLFSGPARAGLLHADPHPGNFRLLADGRLGVLDFGAVDRLPDGFPPFIGRLLRMVHDGGDLAPAERELREQGFLRQGIEFDPELLRAFLAPLAEPSRVERFKFSREWLRGEAARVTDPRSANMSRRLNLPPSYVLIHRVSTAGMGVLCQLESEAPFRAEVIRWIPGYEDDGPWADEPTVNVVSPELVGAPAGESGRQASGPGSPHGACGPGPRPGSPPGPVELAAHPPGVGLGPGKEFPRPLRPPGCPPQRPQAPRLAQFLRGGQHVPLPPRDEPGVGMHVSHRLSPLRGRRPLAV